MLAPGTSAKAARQEPGPDNCDESEKQRASYHNKLIVLSRRGRKAILAGPPGGSRLPTAFGLPAWFVPLPARSASRTRRVWSRQRRDQAPYSWSGFSRRTEVLSAKPSSTTRCIVALSPNRRNASNNSRPDRLRAP